MTNNELFKNLQQQKDLHKHYCSVNYLLKAVSPEESSDVFSKLYSNKDLCELSCDSNGLGENDGEKLKSLFPLLQSGTTLKELSLCANNLSASALISLLSALKKNTLLEKLDLSSNHIDDTGMGALATFLKKNKSLKTLKLSDNSFGPKGAQLLAIALEENNTLIFCELEDNRQEAIPAPIIEKINAELKLNQALIDAEQELNDFAKNSQEKLDSLLTKQKEKASIELNQKIEKHLFTVFPATKQFIAEAIILGYRETMKEIFGAKNIDLDFYPHLSCRKKAFLISSCEPLSFREKQSSMHCASQEESSYTDFLKTMSW